MSGLAERTYVLRTSEVELDVRPAGTDPAVERIAADPEPVTRLTVLPFTVLGDANEHLYLTKRVSNEIADRLTHLCGPRLRVVGTQSPFRPGAARSEPVPSYILTGSMRLSDTSVRMVAAVLDTTSDTYLWSRNYERHLEDGLTAAQLDLAGTIAQSLAAHVFPSDDTPAAFASTPVIRPDEFHEEIS